MDTAAVADFFALTLLGGLVGTVVAASRPSTRQWLQQSALALASMVAIGATLGSLYFSEIADFAPCELCWFQRIAMYPLAVILPIAAFRNDHSIARYVLPVSLAGMAVSIYHIQLQLFPSQSSMCELDNPCSGKWVDALGFMTIPQMAGSAFVLITGLVALSFLSPTTTISLSPTTTISPTTSHPEAT